MVQVAVQLVLLTLTGTGSFARVLTQAAIPVAVVNAVTVPSSASAISPVVTELGDLAAEAVNAIEAFDSSMVAAPYTAH